MSKNATTYSVLVASESKDYMLVIKNHTEKMGIFHDCRFAFNGKDALEKFREMRPDLFILDIILSEIDGLSVLETIKNEGIHGNSKIVVTSATSSEFSVNKSFDYGADFFLIKPISFFTFRGRIMDLLQYNDQKKEESMGDIEKYIVPPTDVKTDLDQMSAITRIIQRIGFTPNMKGYKYVRYAISLGLQDEGILNKITQGLYPAVAENFNTTASRVERDIRHAVEVAWEKGDMRYIENLFGYTVDANRGKPTNSAFIAAIVDYINLNKVKID